MLSVTSLKINNRLYETQSIVLPYNDVIISWQFDESIAGINQDGYELLLSDNSVNWGNMSFLGNKITVPLVFDKSKSFRIANKFINRGGTYYGQIRLQDSKKEFSAWYKFTFSINRLPSITDLIIQPEQPTIDEDLRIKFSVSADFISAKIVWFRNGVRISQFDDFTAIPKSYLYFNDSWYAEVTPFDGIEYGPTLVTKAVKLTKIPPLAQSVNILPNSATVDDILEAEFLSVDGVSKLPINELNKITWYVNNQVIEKANDNKYVRFDLKPNDEVYYVLTPFDGITYGQSKRSASVFVQERDFGLSEILVDGQANNVLVKTTNPTISWQTSPVSNRLPKYTQIKIGTVSGLSNVLETVIPFLDGKYRVPNNILNVGVDYFANVAVSDSQDTFTNYASTKFRIDGNLWETAVMNNNGWTLEFSLRLEKYPQPNEEPQQPLENQYFTFNICDGTKQVFIRFYESYIDVLLGPNSIMSFDIDNTIYNNFIVIGKDDDLKIFADNNLIINAENKYINISDEKILQITSQNDVQLKCFVKKLAYTVQGAYDIGSAAYKQIGMEKFYHFDGFEVTDMHRIGGNVIVTVNPYAEDKNGQLYQINENANSVKFEVEPLDRKPFELFGLSVSPNYKNLQIAHSNGTTTFANYFISKYESQSNFANGDNPVLNNWELIRTTAFEASSYVDDGLVVDTTIGERQLAISQNPAEIITTETVDSITFISLYDTVLTYDFDVEISDNTLTIYIHNQSVKVYEISLTNLSLDELITNLNTLDTSENYFFSLYYNVYLNNSSIGSQSAARLNSIKKSHLFPALTIDGEFDINDTYNQSPYGTIATGKWYYTQRKKGTAWFDKVDNQKGWTVDFSARIEKIEDSSTPTNIDEIEGVGLYFNDGNIYDTLYFLSQEVVSVSQNKSLPIDTTQLTDYRIIGKDNKIRIFAKPKNALNYNLLDEYAVKNRATRQANAGRPSICSDIYNDLHAVWHDDGAILGRRQIFYSRFVQKDSAWTEPEIITRDEFDCANPQIAIDKTGVIYVVYETSRVDYTDISVVTKINKDWSNTTLLSTGVYNSINAQIVLDDRNGVHIIWEDYRNIQPQIFYTTRNADNGQWRLEIIGQQNIQVTDEPYGAKRPAICHSNGYLYISYTAFDKETHSSIKLITYEISTNTWYAKLLDKVGYLVSSVNSNKADNSDIINNNKGQLFIVWRDLIDNNLQIFSKIISDKLIYAHNILQLTTGNFDANHPSCGLDTTTGDVYVVFEKVQEEIIIADDPYSLASHDSTLTVPSIFLCKYVAEEQKWYSSNQYKPQNYRIPFDVRFIFANPRLAYRPKINKYFSGDLHILFESTETSNPASAIPNEKTFVQIKDIVYNYRFEPDFDTTVADEYGGGELSLAGDLLRKEIRFGDFSDNTSSKIVVNKIQYYLGDAVAPFEINLISPSTSNLPSSQVRTTAVNDFGDVWIGTDVGLYYYDYKTRKNYQLIADEYGIGRKKIEKIGFDSNQNMYVLAEKYIYFSVDHNYFYKLTGLVPKNPTDFAFDAFNNLYITSNEGLFVISLRSLYTHPKLSAQEVNNARTIEITNNELIGTYNEKSGLVTENLKCISIDTASIAWIGTDKGLIRYNRGSVAMFTQNNGLSSNVINAVAIRNSSIRYVATSKGIDKMLGISISPINTDPNNLKIATINGEIYGDYKFPTFAKAKSIVWKNPNMLFVASYTDVYQITFLDEAYQTELNELTKFTPFDYAAFVQESAQNDNIKNFRIVQKNNAIEMPENALYEVYLNGKRITRGFKYNAKLNLLRFDYPLFETDVISVVARPDILFLSKFDQNKAAEMALGTKITRLSKITDLNGNYVVATTGDIRSLQINDDVTSLPFDRIIIDRKPPQGKITIGDKVENTNYRINIDPIVFVPDPYNPNPPITVDGFDEITGVDKMVVSNYPNFTSDGIVPLDAVRFARSIVHDIGNSFSTVNKEFDIISGKGKRLHKYTYADGRELLLAGTASPANIYKYDIINKKWVLMTTFEVNGGVANPNASVEFITDYNGTLYVGIGVVNGVAKVYKFNTQTEKFDLFRTIGGATHAYCATVVDGVLYIGAGGKAPSIGSITSYDGSIIQIFAENVSNAVYALAVSENDLYAATGSEGRVYKFDITNKTQSIVDINTDRDCLSIGSTEIAGDKFVFVGLSKTGVIKKSKAPDGAFAQSFKTIPSAVPQIKHINGILHAVIGKYIYQLDEVWTAIHVHTEDIQDIYGTSSNVLYFISDNFIYKLDKNIVTKRVYLKLIDKVGNETSLYVDAAQTVLDENLFDELSLEKLQSIINTNKLLLCDELGKITPIRNGTQDFYSADLIDEEVGEYYSEIFNGANNFVSWDRISWDATTPANTSIIIEIRTGRTRDEILSADFNYKADGAEKSANISFLVGQFIQFKLILRSRVKSLTPTVRSIFIRSVNTDSAHFFTTNFVLPSRIKSGIVTSTKMLPVAADVIFGINVNNSTDFTEYQLVDENRIFTTDDKQVGNNLRVGIKFITPSKFTPADYTPEYGPYQPNVSLNALEWGVTNTSQNGAIYNFIVEFYADMGQSDLLYTANTSLSYVGFSINQDVFPNNGAFIDKNESAVVAYTPLGDTPLRCDTYYYVKIKSVTSIAENIIADDITFYQTCATTYVDYVAFDYVNTSSMAENYHFRIRFYNNAERTDLKYTAFSGNDTANWTADNIEINSYGVTIEPDNSTSIVYVADKNKLEANKTYFISIDVFDGLNFINVSSSLTFVINPFDKEIKCGDMKNVPVVKNFGLMFELENNEFVNLRIK